jgi:glycerophosphoryl diester phosphodiesterase
MAHRGFWAPSKTLEALPQNSFEAFKRAEGYGFGIETDIRDLRGTVVISHDPIIEEKSILNLGALKEIDCEIALNIKSDGLLNLIDLSALPVQHFFFDGSVPEMMKYREKNMNTAIRLSDIESSELSDTNYWVDYFKDVFWFESILDFVVESNRYYLVSPELHGDPHLNFWKKVKPLFLIHENLHICTDFPLDFLEFMND